MKQIRKKVQVKLWDMYLQMHLISHAYPIFLAFAFYKLLEVPTLLSNAKIKQLLYLN